MSRSVARRGQTQKGQYAGWRARKAITIDHTKLSGTVSPFVANIDLSADTDVPSVGGRADLADIRFTDPAGTPLTSEVEVQGGAELTGDASWCWFNDPRAICFKGSHNRMYMAYTAGATGSIVVQSLDLDTGVLSGGQSLHAAFEVDDHSCPGLVAWPDGHLMAFYAQHNTTTGTIQWRRSAVEDVTAASWTTEQSIQASTSGQNACYPNPHLLSSENGGLGRLYVFFRDNHSQLSYFTADNYTSATPSWSSTQPFITNGSTAFIYNKQISNGTDRIDICFTDDAPDLAGTQGQTVGTNNLYHVYVKNGNVCSADGTVISSLASLGTGLTPSSLTGARVATQAQGGPYWTWDIVYDQSGNPCFVYVRFPNSDWSAMEYWYARWTGSAWQRALITVGGNSMASTNQNTSGGTSTPSYAGGIAISHEDANTVYLSKQVAKQGSPDAFEIEKWTSADSGQTWSRSARITPGSRRKNTRPVCPRGRTLLTSTNPIPEVLFMSGGYTSYQHLSQSMLAYPAPTGLSVKRAARVQIPSVDNSLDKQVLMWYGNPSASDQSSDVFSSNAIGLQPWIPRWVAGNSLEHAPELNMQGLAAFTLAVWFTMPTSETDSVVDFIYSNANLGTRVSPSIRLWLNNGVPSADILISGNTVIGGAFSDKTGLNNNTARAIVVTYDSTTLSLYVDGSASSTTYSPASPPKTLITNTTPSAAEIGWSPAIALASTQRRFKGTITDFRLYNTVQSAAWIAAHAKLQAGLISVGSNVSRQW